MSPSLCFVGRGLLEEGDIIWYKVDFFVLSEFFRHLEEQTLQSQR